MPVELKFREDDNIKFPAAATSQINAQLRYILTFEPDGIF